MPESLFQYGPKHRPVSSLTTDEEIKAGMNEYIRVANWSRLVKNLADAKKPMKGRIFIPSLHALTKFTKPTVDPEQLKDDPINHLHYLLKTKVDEYLVSRPNPTRFVDSILPYSTLLKDNPSVKFTQADKNLGITAWPLAVYKSMVMDHLSTTTVYSLVVNVKNSTYEGSELQTSLRAAFNALFSKIGRFASRNRTKSPHWLFTSGIEAYVNKYVLCIDESLFGHFIVPTFYVLAKLHKWKPTMPRCPSRPIVGAVHWWTTFPSVLIDVLLQKFIKIKSHILKDVHQYTKVLREYRIPEIQRGECIIFTMDVSSLYTNINIPRLINIIRNNNLLDNLGIEILSFVLHNNYVHFNDLVYRQIDGIAMGTNCAVALANIYLHYGGLDLLFLDNPLVINYGRYIDDIIGLYFGTEPELLALKTQANNKIPGITLTMEYSKSSAIPFLDIELFFYQDRILFRTYQKILNTYQYLTHCSQHPRATIAGFIKGELTRYRRTNSLIADYSNIKFLFLVRLLRGFNYAFLSPIFERHTFNVDNEAAITIKQMPLVLVIKYSCRDELLSLKKRLMPLFIRYEEIIGIKPMIAWSGSQNVGLLLCKSALSQAQIDQLTPAVLLP